MRPAGDRECGEEGSVVLAPDKSDLEDNGEKPPDVAVARLNPPPLTTGLELEVGDQSDCGLVEAKVVLRSIAPLAAPATPSPERREGEGAWGCPPRNSRSMLERRSTGLFSLPPSCDGVFDAVALCLEINGDCTMYEGGDDDEMLSESVGNDAAEPIFCKKMSSSPSLSAGVLSG